MLFARVEPLSSISHPRHKEDEDGIGKEKNDADPCLQFKIDNRKRKTLPFFNLAYSF
jgi:hypothetical protein